MSGDVEFEVVVPDRAAAPAYPMRGGESMELVLLRVGAEVVQATYDQGARELVLLYRCSAAAWERIVAGAAPLPMPAGVGLQAVAPARPPEPRPAPENVKVWRGL
jgi:hypothetical protein